MKIRPGSLRAAAATLNREKTAFAGNALRSLLMNPGARAALTGAAVGGATSLFDRGEPDDGFGAGLWRFARNAALGAGMGYGGHRLMSYMARNPTAGRVTVLPKQLPPPPTSAGALPPAPAGGGVGPTISVKPVSGGSAPAARRSAPNTQPAGRVLVTPPPVDPNSIALPGQATSPLAYKRLGRQLMRQPGTLSTGPGMADNIGAFGPVNPNFKGTIPAPPPTSATEVSALMSRLGPRGRGRFIPEELAQFVNSAKGSAPLYPAGHPSLLPDMSPVTISQPKFLAGAARQTGPLQAPRFMREPVAPQPAAPPQAAAAPSVTPASVPVAADPLAPRALSAAPADPRLRNSPESWAGFTPDTRVSAFPQQPAPNPFERPVVMPQGYAMGPGGQVAPTGSIADQGRFVRRMRAGGRYDYDPRRRRG